jgi:hypothetical protein
MRIAICFSGMIRTGIHASYSIKQFLRKYYDSCDFFAHTWDISQEKRFHPDCPFVKNTNFDKPEISSYSLLDTFSDAYDRKFQSIVVENFYNWNAKFIKEYKDFSPLWYSWYKSIQLKRQYEIDNNFRYDFVIKMRPDIVFPEDRNIEDEINHYEKNTDVFYANGYQPIRIDDVLFYSNSSLMDRASKFFIDTHNKSWTTNLFGEYIALQCIECYNSANLRYTILRDEATPWKNFEHSLDIDRKYYCPYNLKHD